MPLNDIRHEPCAAFSEGFKIRGEFVTGMNLWDGAEENNQGSKEMKASIVHFMHKAIAITVFRTSHSKIP